MIRAITYAISHNPDILCLQEVPHGALPYLKKIPGYYFSYCYDFDNSHPKRRCYICTLTRVNPTAIRELVYKYDENKSLLNKLFYKPILKNIEMNTALSLTIRVNRKTYQVLNARLSSAIGSNHRVELFKTIMSFVEKSSTPIICGDMNVLDSRVFQIGTGWMRGFTKADYRINERKAFESLFKMYGLRNIFRGVSTFITKRPLLQFDHILVTQQTKIRKKFLSRRSFGSDHRMLLAEIEK